MRFATLKINGAEQGCIRLGDDVWMPLNKISSDYDGDLLEFICLGLSKDSLKK